ncbi:helix-turn-helix domain-containing protein [Xanthomonas sacchari]|uniref:helix-turn-helix domain-containing protein n=1 Tax=Xanthomonas sacchari TaxID=56458 RepID=UPI00068F1600|nr:AraC family transcriptional regulator [Xanthomonas sacchari]
MPALSPPLRLRRYAAGSLLPAHAHAEPWLCLVLAGAYEETTLGRSRGHGAGDLLFCPAETPHSQRFGADGAFKLLLAPPAHALDYLRDRGVALAQAPHLRGSAQAMRIGAQLRREHATDDAYSALVREGLVLELLASLARGGDAVRPGSAPPWLRRVRQCLDEAPGALDLSALAQVAGRHPAHLARAFRACYGCTPGDYRRRAQADRAAALLRGSRRPLLEIALDCGYSSAAQFSRAFKAAYGTSPSLYRDGSR